MPDDTPAAPMPPPLVDTEEQFAKRLQVSKRTVSRLIAQGMPFIRLGDLRRISPSVALNWLANRNKPKPVRRGRPRMSDR
jgi:excisionase family DNA binding protein